MNRSAWVIPALFAMAALAASARATTIGPDAYGYIATDVPYAWVELEGTLGVQTWSPGSPDNFVKVANMGFSFPFYGSTDNWVRFSTNGLITFGQDNDQAGNVDLSAEAPAVDKPSIAPLWDDWYSEKVYYNTLGSTGSRRFVVQWEDIGLGPSGSMGRVTFEAILYEATGDILFQYQDVVIEGSDGSHDNGKSATVGIRDTLGHTNGENLQWSYNQPLIASRQAIQFSIIPEPVTLAGMVLGAGSLVGYVRRRRAGGGPNAGLEIAAAETRGPRRGPTW